MLGVASAEDWSAARREIQELRFQATALILATEGLVKDLKEKGGGPAVDAALRTLDANQIKALKKLERDVPWVRPWFERGEA